MEEPLTGYQRCKYNMNENYKLDDSVIANIAKLVQIAILTGTDIVDNLRTLSLNVDPTGEKLILNPEYEKSFDANINKMMENIQEQNSED